jgi:AraC-like DNA-binding protein
MSRKPLSPFLDLAFRNPTHPGLSLETFTLSELRQRLTARYYERGQRLLFHLLILYTDGAGEHEVDFEPIACRPGTLIHVRPGQVQRYLDIEHLEAQVIFFTSDFILLEGFDGLPAIDASLYDDAAFRSVIQLGEAAYADLLAGFDVIRREYGRRDGRQPSVSILRHQLQALLLQWAREARASEQTSGVRGRQQELFFRFRRLVEQEFARTRRAEDYAIGLDCSARTLNRVCHALAGRSAKAYIDARVLLEARRLLAYTSLPIARIAGLLGFTESTNFIKFYRRETGRLPGAFRRTYPAAPR